MPEIICNTSPLQYLHQIGQLQLLPRLVQRVIVPTAVLGELAEGRRRRIDLPEPEVLPWVDVRKPRASGVAGMVADLGRGETEVLLLALETEEPVVILDDAMRKSSVSP